MGQTDEYFVPLPAGSEDRPFLVELRYRLPGDGRRLDLPAFPQEPAAVKGYLCLYLPENRTLLGVRGPWSEEFCWRPDGWRLSPVPMESPPQLLGWVEEGLSGVQGTVEDFPTDGRLYVFSTLRPAKPPEGSLRTTTIHARWLDALVFGITLLLGLVLLPARLPARALAIGAAVIGLVLAGVFLPTFSARDSRRRAGRGGVHRGSGLGDGVPGRARPDAAGAKARHAQPRPRRRSVAVPAGAAGGRAAGPARRGHATGRVAPAGIAGRRAEPCVTRIAN